MSRQPPTFPIAQPPAPSAQAHTVAPSAQRLGGLRSWGRNAGRAWREAFAGQTWSGRLPPASATLAAQVWAEAAPWRVTAGWAMFAGLLTANVLDAWSRLDWKLIVLLWLLVDLLWGALWRLAGGRPQLLALKAGPAAGGGALRLPYLAEGSPASQLMRLDEANSIPYLVRVAVPTLLLTLVVAAAIGLPALIYTGLLAAVAVGGWTLRRTLQVPPLLLHAVATVLLPWLLAVQVGQKFNEDAAAGAFTVGNATLWLALAWTLHAWGEGRAVLWPEDKLAPWLLGAAQLAMLAVLVLNRSPIWVPLTAVLLLPTWLRVLRKQPLAGPGGLAAWWLAALLASALALGWQ